MHFLSPNPPVHCSVQGLWNGESGGVKRRCQIKVQFESGAKTKFLESLFQPMTQILNYQSVP